MAESYGLEEIFAKATEYVKQTVSRINPEDLLELYGFYKQATIGPCNVSKPGWYDFEGKQKWNAWNQLNQLPKPDAMFAYCDKLSEIDPDWEEKLDNLAENSSMNQNWVTTSCLPNLDVELDDGDKNIFEWVKEGNIKKVETLSSLANVNDLDDSGLAVLHWATDRGNLDMVKYLVSSLKADVNLRDCDGQTPLHYAVSCDHFDVVEYLLKNGAKADLRDDSETAPIDISENQKISDLLMKNSATA